MNILSLLNILPQEVLRDLPPIEDAPNPGLTFFEATFIRHQFDHAGHIGVFVFDLRSAERLGNANVLVVVTRGTRFVHLESARNGDDASLFLSGDAEIRFEHDGCVVAIGAINAPIGYLKITAEEILLIEGFTREIDATRRNADGHPALTTPDWPSFECEFEPMAATRLTAASGRPQ